MHQITRTLAAALVGGVLIVSGIGCSSSSSTSKGQKTPASKSATYCKAYARLVADLADYKPKAGGAKRAAIVSDVAAVKASAPASLKDQGTAALDYIVAHLDLTKQPNFDAGDAKVKADAKAVYIYVTQKCPKS